jgi:hypothetical protein
VDASLWAIDNREENRIMTIQHQIELECPDCHEIQVTSVWSSINVQVNPEAKQELLKGKVNVLYCHKCGNHAGIVTALLYHDMEQQFWVQYYPFDRAMSADLAEDFSAEGEVRTEFPGKVAGYTSRPPHVVFDMGELVRYVLFRDRLSQQSRARENG